MSWLGRSHVHLKGMHRNNTFLFNLLTFCMLTFALLFFFFFTLYYSSYMTTVGTRAHICTSNTPECFKRTVIWIDLVFLHKKVSVFYCVCFRWTCWDNPDVCQPCTHHDTRLAPPVNCRAPLLAKLTLTM